jgi:hypothetical protein
MQFDRYTKALLAIIAALLAINLFASYSHVRVAHAQADMVRLIPIPRSAYTNGGSIRFNGTIVGTVCPPLARFSRLEPLQQTPALPDSEAGCFALVRE